MKWLQDRGISIWDEWADDNGDLGPVYTVPVALVPTPDGRHVDQIAQVVDQIRTTRLPRRHVVSAWNVTDILQMALAPCHDVPVLYVAPCAGRRVARLSLPALPALGRRLPRRAVQHRVVRPAHPAMVAQVTGLEVGGLLSTPSATPTSTSNHLDQARLQLTRDPRPLPTLVLDLSVTGARRASTSSTSPSRLRPAPGHQGADRGMSAPVGAPDERGSV